MVSRARFAAYLIAFAFLLGRGLSAQDIVPGALGWDQLYASRLEASAASREAAIGVKSAILALEQYTKPYIPTVSLSTSAASPFKISSSGFAGGSLVSSLGIENLLGADIALRVPLKMATSGALSLDDPTLSVSRKLFTEDEASRLDAEAALLNAKASLKNAQDTVRINLAREVLNAKYYKSLLDASRKNLEVLERVQKATVNTTTLRELERRILGARKSLLSATKALEDISSEVKDNQELLVADLLRIQGEWVKNIETKMPETSLSTQALEFTLAAAEKRGAFALLPYLPNPNIAAELSYDTNTQSLDWALSLSLSYNVADKGRKSLEALKRREYPEIYRARLSDSQKSLSEGIRTIKTTIESLELDLKIQQLDIEDARDELATMEALYQGGFVNEESLVIASIDFSVESLEAEKIQYDILIQKLNLAKYFESAE